MIRGWTAGVLAAGVTAAAGAHAQTPAEKADELYRRAQSLLEAGKLAEACTDFRASESLDSALGSVLSVAYCDENEGKPASAWIKYVTVALRAHERGQAEREEFARGRAKALEGQVTHVRLAGAPPDAHLTLDGAPAIVADDGTILVPPGTHALGAVAAGQTPWSREVTFGEARVTPDPAFAVDLGPGAAVSKAPAPQAGPEAPPTQDPGATRRWIGIGAAGAGVVGIVIGSIFGVKTLGISGECPVKNRCPQADIDAANASSIASDVGFAVGIAGLGAGAWLFFGAPRAAASKTTGWELRPSLSARATGVALERTW